MGLAKRSGAAGVAVLGAVLLSGCFPAHCHNYAAGGPEMQAACAAFLRLDGRSYLPRSVDIRVEGQPMEQVARIPPCYDQGRPCVEQDPSEYPTQRIARIPGIDPDKAFISPGRDPHSIYLYFELSGKQAKEVYERAVEAMKEAQ